MNYLKFESREIAVNLISEAYPSKQSVVGYEVDGVGMIQGDGYIEQSATHFIYETPLIPKTDGEYDPETGEVITEPTFVEGSHWNLKSDTVPDNLKPFFVYPETPSNVVLGDEA